MVLRLQSVFQVLGVVLDLANTGRGEVGEVVNDLFCRFLFCQLLQLCEGLGLSCCKTDDEFPVYLPSFLSWQIQLLQLGQAGADHSIANNPFNPGS